VDITPEQLVTDPAVLNTFRRIAAEEGANAARRYALRIQEEDGDPYHPRARVLKVGNGSLTVNDDGSLSFAPAGTSLTVEEEDGTPSVSSVTTIGVTNGTLTDNGGGDISLDLSGGGGGGTTWLDPVPSGNAPGATLDDEFDDDSIDGVWTQVTVTGTATWTESKDVLSCLFGNQTASDLAVILKPIGALTTGDYIETALRAMMPVENFTLVGICMTDGTDATSNVVLAETQSNNSFQFQYGTLTNVSTGIGANAGNFETVMGWMFIRLTYVSANTWRAEFSPDGVSWAGMGFSDGGPTMTPTHIGLLVSSWGDTSVEKRVATFEYFRTSVA
jgi:hypothetical protein